MLTLASNDSGFSYKRKIDI